MVTVAVTTSPREIWIGEDLPHEVIRRTYDVSEMIGQHISHYHILRKLGEGGMGAVYEAEDIRLGRTVALKILAGEGEISSAVRVESLRREAIMGSTLNHPNIATVYDLGIEGAFPFIVFEYIAGGTLSALLAQRMHAGKPLTSEEVVRLGLQIAGGLTHAHRRGVVHGDIKTENLMLGEEGELKITDFGISALMSEDASLRSIGGTVAYMSPEQIRREPVDHRSDLFSLGVVLYELSTGTLPFRGAYVSAVEYTILNEAPIAIGSLRSDLALPLVGVIDRLLQKDPTIRFQGADEVVAQLEEGIRQSGLPQSSVPQSGLPQSGLPQSDVPRQSSVSQVSTMAVLPLANKSPDPENEYLADGITEEIIHALTKIDGLRVAAPASTFLYKGRGEDIGAIGRRLGVAALLDGSVRRVGNRLRIIVQLVEVATGFDLWSERYDRQMNDLFEVQEEIAHTIVETLRVRIKGEAAEGLMRHHTSNLEAYTLYLKGRFELNRRTVESLRGALASFEDAVRIDPAYALGHTGIADTCALMSWYGGIPPGEALARAKVAARRALEIDDSLAEAHASMALVLQEYDWDWLGSEREFLRAIELNHDYAIAHHWYGLFLTRMGRFSEAEEEFKQALLLDPMSLAVNTGLGLLYYSARRYSRAIEQLGAALDIDRNYFPAIYFLGMVYGQSGRFSESIAMLRRATELQEDNLETLALLCHASAVGGRVEEAEELLARLMVKAEERHLSSYHLALIYTALGRTEEAFAALQRGFAERSMRLLFLNVDPALDRLRSDARFDELIRKIGFPLSQG